MFLFDKIVFTPLILILINDFVGPNTNRINFISFFQHRFLFSNYPFTLLFSSFLRPEGFYFLSSIYLTENPLKCIQKVFQKFVSLLLPIRVIRNPTILFRMAYDVFVLLILVELFFLSIVKLVFPVFHWFPRC